MNDLKFSYQQMTGENYLEISAENYTLDETAVNVIQQDCPEFLVPVKLVEINGVRKLRYRFSESMIALKYLERELSKEEFITLYRNLIDPFMNCSDWFLDGHQFYPDLSRVYLNKRTWKIAYLYVPFMEIHVSDEEIFSFLRNVLFQVQVKNDGNLLLRLIKYFERKEKSLVDIQEILKKEAKDNARTAAPEKKIEKRGIEKKTC